MSKRLLIIEDSVDIRENTAELLELSGFTVETASDGLEGVRLARTWNPDLVICDIMMPNLDGFGVLQVFSSQPELASIPFIFLTAKTDRADMRKGMEMGADDYLTKPFQEVELLRAIEARLKKSKTAIPLSASVSDVALVHEALAYLDLPTWEGEKKTQTHAKKQVIYAEGDHPIRLYYLAKGKVKAYHTNKDGKYFITSFIQEGEFFGFVDILENQAYRESAEALEESVIISVSAVEFLQRIKENIHLEVFFRKALTSYLLKNEKLMVEMAYQSLRMRVAMVLVELAQTYGTSMSEPLVIKLSREDLASRVGTATESVIRTLSDFKKEGYLDVKGGEMTLKNIEGLVKLKY
ncbi:response regulator [Aquirufa sp. HETE-83D]|uniref:Response regulator n=1 Tax=Aquirufa esocilacus TaxID=3096513 RepID=A0ABW6DG03_9BACT